MENNLDIEKENKNILALVVFAGADPVKISASVFRLLHQGGLDALFIYHTDNLLETAEKLRKFAMRQWPALKTVLACEPGTDSPMSVASRLRDWRIMRKDIRNWTYDITGAAQSMVAAVSRVVCEEGGEIISANGCPEHAGWVRYLAASGGRLLPDYDFADPPEDTEADSLDLPSLLELVANRDSEIIWHGSRPAVKLSPKEISDIAARGLDNNWSWRESFREVTGKSAPIDWDFEDYIASALLAIGIKNVRVNVSVKIKDKPAIEQSYSIVALHRGEIWTFDCRTGADSGEGADIRPWRLFGQRVVAIRPDRKASTTETILTTKRHILLDANDCRSIFDCLASMMSVMLPGEFDNVERRSLSRSATAKLPVFSPSSQARQFSEAMHVSPGVFNLKRGAATDFAEQEPPWFAARLSQDLWTIGGNLKKQVTFTEGRNRLNTTLQRARLDISIVFFELAENRLDWTVVVKVKDAAAFSKWLQKWQNLPLFV